MRNSYPKKESVLVIDSGEYIGKIIFPSYSADAKIHQKADVRVVGGIKGNMNPLVKAYAGEDRNSEYVLVNVTRIHGFMKDIVDVPAGILSLVEEYNELFPKYRINQRDDEELDMEMHDNITRIAGELNTYFEK